MQIVPTPGRAAALEERKALDRTIRERWPDIKAYVRDAVAGDPPPSALVPPRMFVARNGGVAYRVSLWGGAGDETMIRLALTAVGLSLDTPIDEVQA